MAKCAKCETNDTFDTFDICKDCVKNALDKPDIIINNLLAYVNTYRKRSTNVKLFNACIKFFSKEDITSAKVALYDEYNVVLGTAPRRLGSKHKSKAEFELEDILEAFTALDRKSIDAICASSNVKDLPNYNPEELELSSIVERIISMENKLQEHSTRLDENFTHLTKNKSEIETNKRNISNIQNEVQSSINIANKTRTNVHKQESEVTELKNKIESGRMPTYAAASKSGLSNARSVSPQPNMNRRPSAARRPSGNDNNWRVAGSRKRPPARYGTINATSGSYNFGMPLPSRYVVIERVKKGKTIEDINDYIKSKNNNIPIRSIKFMSNSKAYSESFLIEVSLEHINIFKKEDFWPEGVRFRDFRGNGRLWKDSRVREEEQNEENEEAED